MLELEVFVARMILWKMEATCLASFPDMVKPTALNTPSSIFLHLQHFAYHIECTNIEPGSHHAPFQRRTNSLHIPLVLQKSRSLYSICAPEKENQIYLKLYINIKTQTVTHLKAHLKTFMRYDVTYL